MAQHEGEFRMKNFKDLFHNTNDIIIALVIVMMAAGVIVWRFNVIMKYPGSCKPVKPQAVRGNLELRFYSQVWQCV